MFYRPFPLEQSWPGLALGEATRSFGSSAARLWRVFGAAVFLVVVPVFFQAPLVRCLPGLSLIITGVWLFLGLLLLESLRLRLWGDLLIGFTWTWLAGSIYWGWFRWEPSLHLPIEAIALPVVLGCIMNRRVIVGSYFYLGSLLGTALTDCYFYWTDLIPYWRSLMIRPPEEAPEILHQALNQVQTVQGFAQAGVLVVLLIMVGTLPLASEKLQWWAFGGAVLSTIVVDSLFGLAAFLA